MNNTPTTLKKFMTLGNIKDAHGKVVPLTVEIIPDRNGNGDEVFTGSNVKTFVRHGSGYNYGNSKDDSTSVDEECWKGYKQLGMKKKGKKEVPNCVPEETLVSKVVKKYVIKEDEQIFNIAEALNETLSSYNLFEDISNQIKNEFAELSEEEQLDFLDILSDPDEVNEIINTIIHQRKGK